MGGGWVRVEGRWMGGRPHLRFPHSYKTRSGMLSTPPHLRVHETSHKSRQIEG